MATEKTNLAAPIEPVGYVAEDAQMTTVNIAEEASIEADSVQNEPVSAMGEAFADEEAALAADEAGLSIEDEMPEEEEGVAVERDTLSGLNEEELVELFARKIESEPVQLLRPTVEAIKIALYKQHRAKVDAERKAFVEAGGDEAAFTPSEDAAEKRFKELFAI